MAHWITCTVFLWKEVFKNDNLQKKRRNRFFTFDTAYCWKQHLKSWVKAPREKNDIQFSSISVIHSEETLLYLGEQSVEIILHRQATLKNGHLNSLKRPRNYFEKITKIFSQNNSSWAVSHYKNVVCLFSDFNNFCFVR